MLHFSPPIPPIIPAVSDNSGNESENLLSYEFEPDDDEILEDLVLKSQNQIRKIPYKTHPFTISDGQTALDSDEGPIPLQIFGNHMKIPF